MRIEVPVLHPTHKVGWEEIMNKLEILLKEFGAEYDSLGGWISKEILMSFLSKRVPKLIEESVGKKDGDHNKDLAKEKILKQWGIKVPIYVEEIGNGRHREYDCDGTIKIINSA